MQHLVAAGSPEWVDQQEQVATWREDAAVVNEPLIAGILPLQVLNFPCISAAYLLDCTNSQDTEACLIVFSGF